MADPVLRAELDNGDVYDDPTETLLVELLADIDAGEGRWVIVERVGDPTHETYTQALRDHDGSYVVERRLGTPESHEAVWAPNVRTATEQLVLWAFAL